MALGSRIRGNVNLKNRMQDGRRGSQETGDWMEDGDCFEIKFLAMTFMWIPANNPRE
jgi:hypothetical protein